MMDGMSFTAGRCAARTAASYRRPDPRFDVEGLGHCLRKALRVIFALAQVLRR